MASPTFPYSPLSCWTSNVIMSMYPWQETMQPTIHHTPETMRLKQNHLFESMRVWEPRDIIKIRNSIQIERQNILSVQGVPRLTPTRSSVNAASWTFALAGHQWFSRSRVTVTPHAGCPWRLKRNRVFEYIRHVLLVLNIADNGTRFADNESRHPDSNSPRGSSYNTCNSSLYIHKFSWC
jgi:hypothetical protein